MVAPYRMDNDSFRVEKPRAWEETRRGLRELLGDRTLALHRDGVRVAIAPPSERETAKPCPLDLVSNLFDYLRSIAPPNPSLAEAPPPLRLARRVREVFSSPRHSDVGGEIRKLDSLFPGGTSERSRAFASHAASVFMKS